MPSKFRKDSVGLGIRGPEVQYSLEVFFVLEFLFSRSKASDANIGITVNVAFL